MPNPEKTEKNMEENTKKKPIDFTAITRKLLQHKKKFFIVLPATLIITYVLTLFVPRYYSCGVSLAPETSTSSLSGSLGSLASSFGLGGSLAKMNSEDAIFAEIYPDVIGSYDFIAQLMTVEVETMDGKVKTNYYTYLRDHQKDAWWNILLDKTKRLFTSAPPADNYSGEEKIDVFNLTKLQNEIFMGVRGKIECSVDKKTNIVSIVVKDQDPLVCATMAKATCENLQKFIIDYRTNKTRIDYEYYKKLCEESKVQYDEACKAYAAVADANQNVILASYKTKLESLENEMQLKYNAYMAMNTQMQAAAAKLQEATPAFTMIETASVPVKPAGPKRMFISIGMMMLAFFILSARVLLKGEQ